MKVVIGILIGGVAGFLGLVCGMILAGYGICETNLSWGIFSSAVVIAAVISLVGAAVLPSARWVAPVLFSLPALLGIWFAGTSRDWLRCLAIAGSIAGGFLVAWLYGFARRAYPSTGANAASPRRSL